MVQGTAHRAGDAQRCALGATARTGSLQVARDYTADPHLLVLLNVQRTVDQWGDLMDYEQQEIELAISYAATLCWLRCMRAWAQGLRPTRPLWRAAARC